MANPYKTRFIGKSALRLDGSRIFKSTEYYAILKDAFDIRSDDAASTNHIGIQCTVEVYAENILYAIDKAAMVADQILSGLALTHGTAIETPKMLFALDVSPGQKDREFAQVIRDSPELVKIRRPFSDDNYRPFHDLLGKVDSSYSSRIGRALYYLRRSYLESDPLDRFEDLAAGLQCIDNRISKKFGLPTIYTARCMSCKKPIICSSCNTVLENSDNWSGTSYVIEKILKRSELDSKRLRQKRNHVAHALKEIPELLENIEELSTIANEALVAGILVLVDAEESYLKMLLRKPLFLLSAPEFLVTATLHNLSMDVINERKQYPTLKLVLVHMAVTADAKSLQPSNIAAIALDIEAVNHTDNWTPGAAYATLGHDPAEAAPNIQILVQKVRATPLESSTVTDR